jgi:hypothetical protein
MGKMISANQKSQLIFYEPCKGSEPKKGVWSYQLANNTWTKLGEMLISRDDFAVLPVEGMECP